MVRQAVIAVCVLGVAGMVGGSIANRIGVAITAGVIAAIAVLCLILVTAVAGAGAFGASPPVDETAAVDLERRITELIAAGADEVEVRSLVRAATRFGRRQPN